MSNTLTGLYPTIYAALNKVSREHVGFIPAVRRNTGAERAAIGQNFGWPVVAAQSVVALTPAVTMATPADFAATLPTATITDAYYYPFALTGEEQKGLSNSQTLEDILQQHFENAFRLLSNKIELALFNAIYKGSSRAYGSAGVTPFATASDMSDLAQVRKILQDNGAPMSNLHAVLNSSAGANLRGKMSNLFKSNEAGSSDLLRNGSLTSLPLEGFNMHESGQIIQHTKGTGTGYLVDLTAGYAAGKTTAHIDTGTGTILAGDILTNTKTGRDTTKYVVNTGFAGDGDGDIVLSDPGLQVAWVNNDPVAVGSNYTPNMVFDGDAAFLVARPPAAPERDAALDSMLVTDQVSGLTFDVREYGQFYQQAYIVAIAWGTKVVKPAHIATLLG